MRNNTPTPIRPSAATESPITAPPLNATIKACPGLFSEAACAVRTFDMVAAFMPR